MNAAHLFPTLHGIANFVPVSIRLATAGQPTAEEFIKVRYAGFESVINLAWHSSPEGLADQDLLLEDLGIEYVPIPVRWQEPTRENLNTFFDAMDERRSLRLFVHCIANKRVSAFLYLYRVLRLGVSEPGARTEMLRVWTPNEIWQPFIDSALSDPTSV